MSAEDKNPNMRKNFTIYYEDLAQRFKPSTVLVFGKVKRLADGEGFCFASQPRIANELGIDRKTVASAIEELLKENLIVDTTEKFKGRYSQILKKKGKIFRKSRYKKEIRLFSVSMDRFDEIVKELDENIGIEEAEDDVSEDPDW